MAHSLQIYSNSGTIDLTGLASPGSGVGVRLREYTPQAGAVIGEESSVAETLTVSIEGTAYSNINNTVGSINRLFDHARTWQQKKTGERVFISYQPDGYTEAYRAEIMDGVLQPVEGALNYPRWNNKRLLCELNWQRRNYWEGTLTPVTVSNTNGTSSAGVRIYNCSDATGGAGSVRVNYIDVAATAIVGDLPAPAYYEFRYTGGSVTAMNYMTIYKNENSNPSTFAYTIDTMSTLYGAAIASAQRSQGTVWSATFGMPTAAVQAGTISNMQIYSQYGILGAAFAFVGTVTAFMYIGGFVVGPFSNLTLKTDTIYLSSGTAIYNYQDFGLVSIPNGMNVGSFAGTNTQVFLQMTGTLGTALIDYFYFIPIDEVGKYCIYAQKNDDMVFIDPYNDYYCASTSGTPPYDGNYMGMSYSDVTVTPGKAQRFIFKWWDTTAGTAYPNNDDLNAFGTIALKYRPRRLLL